MKFPHSVSISRRTFTIPHTYSDFTVVASDVECLIAPGRTLAPFGSAMGLIPQYDALAFFPAATDVLGGDMLTEEDGTTWTVKTSPSKFSNPRTWEESHIEAELEKVPAGFESVTPN